MTLSHEPWLVWRPGSCPGYANHVSCLIFGSLAGATDARSTAIADTALKIALDPHNRMYA
jgi:TRAP-type C4-dicarboxylate transport system permease large subunit